MTNPINGGPRNRSETLGTSNKAQTSNAKEIKSPADQSDASTNETTASDTVNITSEASRIRELQNSLADVPDINQEKVAAIKQEIANGNYPVDHEQIARNLLDLEKSLL